MSRSDVIVLGLPRGGVVVAAEVAAALHVPLDAWIVRKLRVPGQPELAMGAVASGGVEVRNRDVIDLLQIPAAIVEQVSQHERAELVRSERALRGDRPPPSLTGRSVILVDDGLATGATMEAAVSAVAQLEPREIVVAVPVGARDTCARLARSANRVVALEAPAAFRAVGGWYDDFTQTTDEDVRQLVDAHS